MVYEPREDTRLLLKCAREKFRFKDIKSLLEIGIGSGEIIINLAKEFHLETIVGTDINEKAVTITKKRAEKEKINIELRKEEFYKGKKKFDLVLFNPPYLPQDPEVKLDIESRAIYGGKKGYEVIIKFIEKLKKYIKNKGTCLLVISSLSNPDIIFKKLRKEAFKFKIIKKEKFFFEELYCLEIEKFNFTYEIKNLRDIKYYSRGKHSTVYQGKINKHEIIIKTGDEKFISKERFYLQKLQGLDFIPKIICTGERYIAMEKIKGNLILDFIRENNNEKIINIINKILECTYKLDKININKLEMNHPHKHIIVTKDEKIKFIDFERSRISNKPKNTSQFLQFISNKKTTQILKSKGISINKSRIKEMGEKAKKGMKIKINEAITFD